jgi:hypothetical protein
MSILDTIKSGLVAKLDVLTLLNNVAPFPEIKPEDAPLPNTRALIRIRDRFLAHDKTESRRKAYKNLFDAVIYEHWRDQDYRERIEEIVEMILDEIEAGTWVRPNRTLAPVDDRWA